MVSLIKNLQQAVKVIIIDPMKKIGRQKIEKMG
jgi:hypothetical protein